MKKYNLIIINILTTYSGPYKSCNHVHSFDDYYSQLTPATTLRNPWFTDVYEQYYECKINVSCSNRSIPDDPNYQQDSFDRLIIDAVYSVAQCNP